jgi:predicted nucleic acid-binding protein
MSVKQFLDTNVLVYAYDRDEPVKRKIALGFVEPGWTKQESRGISVQVLQELYVNLERKKVPRKEAAQIVRDLSVWPVVENSVELLLDGLREQERWQVSFWDAMILAAARASGATELVSEDFSDGQDYGGVRVVNPF